MEKRAGGNSLNAAKKEKSRACEKKNKRKGKFVEMPNSGGTILINAAKIKLSSRPEN